MILSGEPGTSSCNGLVVSEVLLKSLGISTKDFWECANLPPFKFLIDTSFRYGLSTSSYLRWLERAGLSDFVSDHSPNTEKLNVVLSSAKSLLLFFRIVRRILTSNLLTHSERESKPQIISLVSLSEIASSNTLEDVISYLDHFMEGLQTCSNPIQALSSVIEDMEETQNLLKKEIDYLTKRLVFTEKHLPDLEKFTTEHLPAFESNFRKSSNRAGFRAKKIAEKLILDITKKSFQSTSEESFETRRKALSSLRDDLKNLKSVFGDPIPAMALRPCLVQFQNSISGSNSSKIETPPENPHLLSTIKFTLQDIFPRTDSEYVINRIFFDPE